jgi:glycosyltransferase involved in cell wall biosynthesis
VNRHNAPLVTVLTPVYNGADFLAECIESVLKQTYDNFEYIIVNNCSTDRTLEIAQEYAARDSRIRVHNNEQFVAVIANHNIAFNLMSPKARYSKMVSGDDYLFPDCLERMVEFA